MAINWQILLKYIASMAQFLCFQLTYKLEIAAKIVIVAINISISLVYRSYHNEKQNLKSINEKYY